jgi:hypothetical protein
MKQQIKRMNAYYEELQGNNAVVYSYSTPIILKFNGMWYTSPKKYSQTTSKQKTVLLRMLHGGKPIELEHKTFKSYCEIAGVSELGLA